MPIAKARADAETKGYTGAEKQARIPAKTPAYLKDRVESYEEKPLPRMEVKQLRLNPNSTKAKRMALLRYVLRDPTECGEGGGMCADVFEELMLTLCPKWDPIRGGKGL